MLVTGGAGFVGSHLVDHLLERGDEVVVMDNLERGSHVPRDVPWEWHDVRVPFECGPVDDVYHLAATVGPAYVDQHPFRTLMVSLDGTRNAITYARQHGARLLLASTSEVYGQPLVHPQPETYRGNLDPVDRRSAYAEGKRAAETMVAIAIEEGWIRGSVARLFNAYGPRMQRGDGRVVPAFAYAALDGEPLLVHGDGRQTRSLCYVDDTVRGLVAVMEAEYAGPVNVGSEREFRVVDVAELVLELTASRSRIEFVEPPRPYSDEPWRRCPDLTRARALGWEPAWGLRDGLASTVAWMAGRERAAAVGSRR